MTLTQHAPNYSFARSACHQEIHVGVIACTGLSHLFKKYNKVHNSAKTQVSVMGICLRPLRHLRVQLNMCRSFIEKYFFRANFRLHFNMHSNLYLTFSSTKGVIIMFKGSTKFEVLFSEYSWGFWTHMCCFNICRKYRVVPLKR